VGSEGVEEAHATGTAAGDKAGEQTRSEGREVAEQPHAEDGEGGEEIHANPYARRRQTDRQNHFHHLIQSARRFAHSGQGGNRVRKNCGEGGVYDQDDVESEESEENRLVSDNVENSVSAKGMDIRKSPGYQWARAKLEEVASGSRAIPSDGAIKPPDPLEMGSLDPEVFQLKVVFIWDPPSQFPREFKEKKVTPCKNCARSDSVIKHGFPTDAPRVIVGHNDVAFFAARRYRCHACSITFSSADVYAVEKLPFHLQMRMPVVLTHKLGVTMEVSDTLMDMADPSHGGLKAFRDMLQNKFLKKFAESRATWGSRVNAAYGRELDAHWSGKFFGGFNQSTGYAAFVSSENFIKKGFMILHNARAPWLERVLQTTTAHVLATDGNYKFAKHIQAEGSVKPYEQLITFMNESHEVLKAEPTQGPESEHLRHMLADIKKRAEIHGRSTPEVVYTDSCCHKREVIQGSLGCKPSLKVTKDMLTHPADHAGQLKMKFGTDPSVESIFSTFQDNEDPVIKALGIDMLNGRWIAICAAYQEDDAMTVIVPYITEEFERVRARARDYGIDIFVFNSGQKPAVDREEFIDVQASAHSKGFVSSKACDLQDICVGVLGKHYNSVYGTGLQGVGDALERTAPCSGKEANRMEVLEAAATPAFAITTVGLRLKPMPAKHDLKPPGRDELIEDGERLVLLDQGQTRAIAEGVWANTLGTRSLGSRHSLVEHCAERDGERLVEVCLTKALSENALLQWYRPGGIRLKSLPVDATHLLWPRLSVRRAVAVSSRSSHEDKPTEPLIRLDPYHALARLTSAISTAHPRAGSFSRHLSLALFSVAPSDVDESALSGTSLHENLKRIQCKARRRIPPPPELLDRLEMVVERFMEADRNDDKPLLQQGFFDEYRNLRAHIRNGCLSDPQDISLYGKINDGNQLYCCRGTEALENFHASLNSCLSGYHVSPELARAFLLEFIVRWNNRQAISHRGMPASVYGFASQFLIERIIVFERLIASSKGVTPPHDLCSAWQSTQMFEDTGESVAFTRFEGKCDILQLPRSSPTITPSTRWLASRSLTNSIALPSVHADERRLLEKVAENIGIKELSTNNVRKLTGQFNKHVADERRAGRQVFEKTETFMRRLIQARKEITEKINAMPRSDDLQKSLILDENTRFLPAKPPKLSERPTCQSSLLPVGNFLSGEQMEENADNMNDNDLRQFFIGSKRKLTDSEAAWLKEMDDKLHYYMYERTKAPHKCSQCGHIMQVFQQEHLPPAEQGGRCNQWMHPSKEYCRVTREETSPNAHFLPHSKELRPNKNFENRARGCPCERCHSAFPFMPLTERQKAFRRHQGLTIHYGEEYDQKKGTTYMAEVFR